MGLLGNFDTGGIILKRKRTGVRKRMNPYGFLSLEQIHEEGLTVEGSAIGGTASSLETLAWRIGIADMMIQCLYSNSC